MSRTYYFSNSDVQAYKNCRRDWWLGSVRNLVPNNLWTEDIMPGTQANKGSLVHLGLKTFYETGDMDIAIASIPEVLEYTVENVVYRNEAYEKDRELAVIMLRGYVDWLAETGADANIKILGVEEEIAVDISEWVGGGYTVILVGKADIRMLDRAGARRIMDHKTVGAISSDTWPVREQLLTYCVIDRMLHPDAWVDGAFVNQLRKVKRTVQAKPPFYGRQPVQFNNEEFHAFWDNLLVIVREMVHIRELLDQGLTPVQAGIVPRPTSDCDWKCPFKDVCPMFDDGSRVEDAIAVHFKKRERSRYDTVPITT